MLSLSNKNPVLQHIIIHAATCDGAAAPGSHVRPDDSALGNQRFLALQNRPAREIYEQVPDHLICTYLCPDLRGNNFVTLEPRPLSTSLRSEQANYLCIAYIHF